MIREVYLHKDENYAIILFRDGHKGITVQLISYMPKQAPNHENVMEEYLAHHVEWSREIKVRLDDVLNKNFKQDLSVAISECQHKLAVLQQNHEYIEGALKDYAVSIPE